MKGYTTLETLHSFEKSSITVEGIFREFFHSDSSDIIGVMLQHKYLVLLDIWADDNNISVDELISVIECSLGDEALFRVTDSQRDMPECELRIKYLVLKIYWDIEVDA